MEIRVVPVLQDGERIVVLIFHDESIYNSNDSSNVKWVLRGSAELFPKSRGRCLMVSGFICDCHGFLRVGNRKSYKIIAPGKNADGYWTNDDLVKQLEEVIPLFEEVHPNCELHFIFDNSQNHHARRPDGLSVNQLNLSDGGKNVPKLRDTNYGDNIIQKMQHDDGTQKGIRTILTERGLWVNGLKLVCKDNCPKNNCCARAILAAQPDFASEKNWLQTEVEKRGHFFHFLPKFHCELNFIEMIWGYTKAALRKKCKYSFEDLKTNLPLQLESVPIAFIRRAARHCFRFLSGYRRGFHGPILDFIMKKYKSHRAIPLHVANADLEASFIAANKAK